MNRSEGREVGGPPVRRGKAALLTALLTLVAAGALSVPFVYESQTLWYKVGFDKTLLRGGQLVGLLAAVSMVVQIMLGVRGKVLEETFGTARLLRWHRQNGLFLVACGFLHATLVLAAQGLTGIIARESWPELVGGLLLTALLVTVASSLLRRQLGLTFAGWRLLHRLLACSFPALLAVHILFVSDSFAQPLPMAGLLITLFALAVAVFWVKWLGRSGR